MAARTPAGRPGEDSGNGGRTGLSRRAAFGAFGGWQEASRDTLGEYAQAAGVSQRAIEELAQEFTSHGKRAVAEFGRGPTMHTNGFYAGRAVMTLKFLLGNLDWAGGYVTGGGGADYTGANPGAPYPLGSWPGQPAGLPSGVPVSRSGASYEASGAYKPAMAEGRSPYPAPRPWFPLGGGQWPEMFAGINQGYPYPVKVLFQLFANPAWSMPAIGGADDAGLPWHRLISDTAKVPLFIATDVFIAESSAYADYIVPDTTYLEGWEFPGCWPVVPTKAQGIRRPVIEPLTHATPSGAPMCLEQFLIDVAKALGLPGFGTGALPGGGGLHVREDLYLKMVANIAYDPQFLTWQGRTLAPAGPVPDGSPADLAAVSGLYRAHRGALRDAEWRKAAYVLARGGRFEDYACAYEPNLDVLAGLAAAAKAQLPSTGVQDWARAPHQPAPEDLAAPYDRFLSMIRTAVGHRAVPAWMASRYGSGGTPCQIYNPAIAGARNSFTGEAFAGTARYEPPHDYTGRLLAELDQPAEFPLVLVTHKSAVTSRGLGSTCPWLAEMSPEAFVDMNPRDAARLGVAAGDQVRVRSATHPRGITGRPRLLPGIRPGVVAFPHGYGHWRYASGTEKIGGMPGEHVAADEDYQSCLVIPQPGRYVPPYASVWLDGAEGLWGPATARVLASYQEAGLDWTAQRSPGHGRPWVRAPDHLGVECAFVAEIAAGTPAGGTELAPAEPAGLADPAAMATAFIAGHLRRWVPSYAQELARHASSQYWQGMAGVLAQ